MAPGRNPDWTYDEAVLLHALYRRRPDAGRGDPGVIALSRFLMETAPLRGHAISDSYRNADGVSMRLRNLNAIDPEYLATGRKGLVDGPAIDRFVWARFAEDPVGLAIEEARILALWSSSDLEPRPANGPSRGPAPTFGATVMHRVDGPTDVYLLRLDGEDGRLTPGAGLASDILKVGMSNDVKRRVSELNAGLPGALGLAWRRHKTWPQPDGMSAWALERRALLVFQTRDWSLGGEFLRADVGAAVAVLNDLDGAA